MRSAITLRRRVSFSVRAPATEPAGAAAAGAGRCHRGGGSGRGGRGRGGRRRRRGRHHRCSHGSSGRSGRRTSGAVRRVEDVLLGDAASDAGSPDGRQVHARLRCELADQRRDVEVRRCSAGVCPSARGLRARGHGRRGRARGSAAGAGAGGAAGSGTVATTGSGAGPEPGSGGCRGSGRSRRPDDAQRLADLRGLVLEDADLQQRPGAGRGQLRVDLVGGDLEQGLVGRHHVADLLQPAGDGALGHGLTQCGQDHGGLRAGDGLAAGARRVGIRGHGPEHGRSGRSSGRHRRARRGSRHGGDGCGRRHGSRGRGGRSRLRGRGRGGGLTCRGVPGRADHSQRRTHGDGLVLARGDGQQHTRGGCGDLGVDLVGRDLDEGLVCAHLLADLLEPAGDGALGDALAELRHGDGDRHLRDS